MAKLNRQSPLHSFSENGAPVVIEKSAVSVKEMPFVEKLLLLGDASELTTALEKNPGLALPTQPNQVSTSDDGHRCLWLRPNQWMLMAADAEQASLRVTMEEALQGTKAYVTDVSSKHQLLAVSGEQASALLATGCTLDFDSRAFPVGSCAQSRIEEVPVIIYRTENTFYVMAERALTYHLWLWFSEVSKEF